MRDRIRKRTSNITGMSFTDLVRMIVIMIIRMVVMIIVRMVGMVKIEKNTHRVDFN